MTDSDSTKLVALRARVVHVISLTHGAPHQHEFTDCVLCILYRDCAPVPVDPLALLRKVRSSLTVDEHDGVAVHLSYQLFCEIDAAIAAHREDGK